MVEEINGSTAIVDINGVGYEIVVVQNFITSLKVGESAVFYIAESIKEDEYTLFGLPNIQSREMYYKLTSVNGVGPKAAIAILSAHEYSAVQDAIMNDDVQLFGSVSGIGKKTAQQMVLDLAGKFVDVTVEAGNTAPSAPAGNLALDEAMEALLALGYKATEIKKIRAFFDGTTETAENYIKSALKMLMK